MTAPSRSGPRPARALVALAAVILIMVISVLGNETLSPGKWQQQFKVSLGLDLSSGTEVVLKAETHDGKPPCGEMQQAISVLQSRVNGNGISGAQVQQQGSDMINVTVPGKPVYNIVNLVSQASQMSVRPVYLKAPYVPPSADRTNQVAYGDSTLVNAATLKLFDKEVCQPGRDANTVNPSWQKTVGYSLKGDQWAGLNGQIVSCDSSGAKYVLGQAVYAGTDITSVSAGPAAEQRPVGGVPVAQFRCRRQVRDAHHQPVQLVLRRLATAATRMTRRSTRPRSSSTAT